MRYALVVGEKHKRTIQVTTTRLADVQSNVMNLEFTCGPEGVPPRQSFRVRVEVDAEVRRVVNALPGRKFFRVFVDGVLMREVC